MSNYSIEEFHTRLLLLMDEVHKICVRNNVQYTLIGGSLLGAIRHKGFIPWDDDIDIGMTWGNYVRFLDVVKNYKHEWLEFDLPGNKGYYQTFIKAYDSRTTFIEEQHTTNQAKGIFIDIMPISNAGNSKNEAYLNFKFHKLILSFYRRKGYDLGKSMLKEKTFKIIGMLIPNSVWLGIIDWQYRKLNVKDKMWVSDMDGSVNGIVEGVLFSGYQKVRFENTEYFIITQYHPYLTHVFGDYMQLPPEEDRTPHHIVYLNLEESYKTYLSRLK